MKSFRALWAAAVAAALALTARSGTASSTSYEFAGAQQVGQLSAAVDRKPVGSITGSITGELLAGGTYQLSAYRGEPVVVNFWGTWCPSCVIATPQFASVYDQYRLKHVAFLGVRHRRGRPRRPESLRRRQPRRLPDRLRRDR